jgi:hypothetical protein
MLGLTHHHHGRHARREGTSREMPATPPLPSWSWPLMDWLERKARGEETDPGLDDWMRSLQRKLDRWQRLQRMR